MTSALFSSWEQLRALGQWGEGGGVTHLHLCNKRGWSPFHVVNAQEYTWAVPGYACLSFLIFSLANMVSFSYPQSFHLDSTNLLG